MTTNRTYLIFTVRWLAVCGQPIPNVSFFWVNISNPVHPMINKTEL